MGNESAVFQAISEAAAELFDLVFIAVYPVLAGESVNGAAVLVVKSDIVSIEEAVPENYHTICAGDHSVIPQRHFKSGISGSINTVGIIHYNSIAKVYPVMQMSGADDLSR